MRKEITPIFPGRMRKVWRESFVDSDCGRCLLSAEEYATRKGRKAISRVNCERPEGSGDVEMKADRSLGRWPRPRPKPGIQPANPAIDEGEHAFQNRSTFLSNRKEVLHFVDKFAFRAARTSLREPSSGRVCFMKFSFGDRRVHGGRHIARTCSHSPSRFRAGQLQTTDASSDMRVLHGTPRTLEPDRSRRRSGRIDGHPVKLIALEIELMPGYWTLRPGRPLKF